MKKHEIPSGRRGTLPGIEPAFRGKVRDIYDLGDRLIIVASDRISAYDSILPTPIPGKGIVLTLLSAAWAEWLTGIPHHILETDVSAFPPPYCGFTRELGGRSMLVRKARRIDLECVVRGYLAGSGWKEYRESGAACGISLPRGLRMSDRLEEPIFTPSTKAESGHDRNITIEEAGAIAGAEAVREVRRLSLEIYRRAHEYAAARGIIIADTKFEFGFIDGRVAVIDEVLTPDSSRFWLAKEYRPGESPPSLDKQYVRDYLDGIGWDHNPPAPDLEETIVRKTSERYRMALTSLFPAINIERYL
ncbi:MAG: phosphoribosylaminoimidazolesuccinocarboxamide synthase [Candidatus Krumholzibacteria bacterium]|nr:phosphoribosylaminoimidazolesuccinocarboxamide synthase [Candidatus Krumholzibacteria bacterium]